LKCVPQSTKVLNWDTLRADDGEKDSLAWEKNFALGVSEYKEISGIYANSFSFSQCQCALLLALFVANKSTSTQLQTGGRRRRRRPCGRPFRLAVGESFARSFGAGDCALGSSTNDSRQVLCKFQKFDTVQ
jgi:hypothetical protein